MEAEWDAEEKQAAEDDDDAPDLEEVDLAELERTKRAKQEEWLNKVIAEQ